jgi:hypothetical protein
LRRSGPSLSAYTTSSAQRPEISFANGRTTAGDHACLSTCPGLPANTITLPRAPRRTSDDNRRVTDARHAPQRAHSPATTRRRASLKPSSQSLCLRRLPKMIVLWLHTPEALLLGNLEAVDKASAVVVRDHPRVLSVAGDSYRVCTNGHLRVTNPRHHHGCRTRTIAHANWLSKAAQVTPGRRPFGCRVLSHSALEQRRVAETIRRGRWLTARRRP